MIPAPPLACLVSFGMAAGVVHAQTLELPPRPADAPGGAEVARSIRSLDLEAREERLYAEISSGNVPDWLRALRPVRMTRSLGGRARVVTLLVAPDYLAVGSDDDYFLAPMTPGTAQRVADLVGGTLPTPAIVDAVWLAAAVRLGPDSIPPGPAMTTVAVYEDHNRMVLARRARDPRPPGALVAGHKKDVVLSARLAASPERVAIYGWHRPGGDPIQPLYVGHTARYADYSHGVRIVAREVLVDGAAHDLLDLLADPALAGLVSDEGVIAAPRYPR